MTAAFKLGDRVRFSAQAYREEIVPEISRRKTHRGVVVSFSYLDKNYIRVIKDGQRFPGLYHKDYWELDQ